MNLQFQLREKSWQGWLLAGLLFLSAHLQAQPAAADDLTALSLDQLADLQITSVSKRPQKQSSAAAAVYVITAEDIHRSGARTIPEALRLAPGVEVARISSDQWAIGIRGFGSRLARSVLVLIDGRIVYSPLFAGTYWEVQDTLIADIDRIEVIRGPGGTLYGANAYNGVINIITKSAKDTHGVYVTGGAGTLERGFTGARIGGQAGGFNYRAYGKYSQRGPTFSKTGSDWDAWSIGQGGFRTDWDVNPDDSLTVQGDLYQGKAGNLVQVATYTSPFSEILQRDSNLFGNNLLGRWKRRASDTSDFAVQTYYDHTYRKDPHFLEYRDTYDLDFQHHFTGVSRNEIVWGTEYRRTSNHTEAVPTIFFDPSGRTDDWISFFAQDQLTLVDNRLYFILGSKFEHNEFSGWEVQPNGRLVWTPTEHQTLWTAVSRALRTPTATDQDLSLDVNVPAGAPSFVRLLGSKDFDSEKVTAYEAGYRVQPWTPLFLDVAGFYNDYGDLLSVEPGTPFGETDANGSRTIFPYSEKNMAKGEAVGFELASTWDPWRACRLRAQYSFIDLVVRTQDGSLDTTTAASIRGSTPRHQVLLQAMHELPGGFEFDPTARYVSELPAQNVPRYWNLDLRLGWHATRQLELALVGQNLLQPHHAEFGSTNEIQRGVYGQVTWRTW